MRYFLAFFPIFLILALMLVFRWGGHRAGAAGWLAGNLIAFFFFGLTFDVWWVSQVKGFLLSFYVLLVLWPALFLFHTVNQTGGIQAFASWFETSIHDRGLLLVLMAWAFSGFLEGMTGFGIPIAVVAPMLVGVGVPPVSAIAAVAAGHSWAVSMGGMGVLFDTLTAITQTDAAFLAGPAAFILGIACLLCGLAASAILGQVRIWPKVLLVAALMAAVQYALAVTGLTALASILAGLAGLLVGLMLNYRGRPRLPATGRFSPLHGALFSYGGLAVLMALLTLFEPLHTILLKIAWIPVFPQVETLQGFLTRAAPGTTFRFFLHPGTSIIVLSFLSYRIHRAANLLSPRSWQAIAAKTASSAAHATLGILAAVGLSSLMEHCGMTLLLAQGLSITMQTAYPLISPLIGMLGAFATGSNNNSNVLFAPLQKDVALLLGFDPNWLLAAQTAGGALGSMISPAKMLVGCSTVHAEGCDSRALRKTLPYGLAIGLLTGGIVFALVQFF
ncbi:MAG: L-lactate permease [Anaerolineaceae bacterium]|nr:L-lactate permease [Anaerolineaceae bacterium]